MFLNESAFDADICTLKIYKLDSPQGNRYKRSLINRTQCSPPTPCHNHTVEPCIISTSSNALPCCYPIQISDTQNSCPRNTTAMHITNESDNSPAVTSSVMLVSLLLFKSYCLHAPTGLNFKNCTFYPTVLMCFVFISKQTTNSAPYNIN